MSPWTRKFALTVHTITSVGLLGSIGVFLALAITAVANENVQAVRAAYLAMDIATRFLIVPLACTALLTGIIQALGTPWGLFRHYWVSAKLLVAAFASIVLLAKVGLVRYAADLATTAASSDPALREIGMELVLHSAAGLLVLLVPAVLSIYKPRGLTRYGKRVQRAKDAAVEKSYPFPQHGALLGEPRVAVVPSRSGSITIALRPGYIVGTAAIVLVLHFLILHMAGGGLSMH